MMGEYWFLIFFTITLILSNSSAVCPGDPGCSCSDVSDCITGTYCSSGTCARCTKDDDCTMQHSVRGKCDSSDHCTQCLTDADCPSGTTCQTDYPHLCGSNSGCSSDSDCPTDRPNCVNTADWGGTGKYCFACEIDRDCKVWKGSSLPYCVGGTCKECKYNSDCDSVSASACVSNACTPCTTSTDCSRFSTTPICKSPGAAGQCVECVTDSDCFSPAASRCLSNSCTACTAQSHCARFHSTPICSTLDGICVECVAESDCFSAAAPWCSLNSCTPCTENSHCGKYDPIRTCAISLGVCLECLTNSECTRVIASKCLLATHVCIPCSLDDDCAHLSSTPHCEGGICISCKTSDNSGCTSITAPKCVSPSYTCTTCSVNADCANFALTPFCSTTLSKCVACLSNADCVSVSTPKCSAMTGTCISCAVNADCSTTPATPMCSTTLSKCVECLTDTDCDSVSAPKCSSSSGSCTACTQDSDCHFTETPACSSSSVCVSVCTKYQTQCTSCSNGLYLLNDTCLSTCPSGYTANRNTNTCDETTNAELIATAQSMATVTSTGASVVSAAMILNTLQGTGGANLLRLTLGAQMVVFCKFINISYPEHVMVYFKDSKPTSFVIPVDLEETISSNNYPEDATLNQIHDNGNLEYFEVSQYVYDNIIDGVATLLLNFVSALLLYGAANFKCSQRICGERMKRFFNKADIKIWNFGIMTAFSNTLEILFYSLLNLYYPTIYTSFGYANFISSIIFVTIVLIYFVWSVIRLKKIYYIKKQAERKPPSPPIDDSNQEQSFRSHVSPTELIQPQTMDQNESKEKQGVEGGDDDGISPKLSCLHEEYESNSLAQQMYIPVTCVRVFLFSVNLALFPGYPQWQSIAALVIHCLYFAYLVILRPNKSKCDFICGVCFELCVIGVTICVVGLAIVTKSADFSDRIELSNNLGWAIVFFNLMLIGGSLVTIAVSVFQAALKLCQLCNILIEKIRLKRLQRIIDDPSMRQDNLQIKDLDRESIQGLSLAQLNGSVSISSRELISHRALEKPDSNRMNEEDSMRKDVLNEKASRKPLPWVKHYNLKNVIEKTVAGTDSLKQDFLRTPTLSQNLEEEKRSLKISQVSVVPSLKSRSLARPPLGANVEGGSSLGKEIPIYDESQSSIKNTENTIKREL